MEVPIMTKIKCDRISSLPEEIIEMIAKQSREHVLSLRSTCRDLEHKTWRTISTTYFATRHIWVNARSLGTINELAKSERVSACVKKLTIETFAWKDATPYINENLPMSPEPPEERQLGNDQVSEQHFLLHSGQFAALLSSAISKLPNLEQLGLSTWASPDELWPSTHLKFPTSPWSWWIIDHCRDRCLMMSVWFAILASISRTRTSLKYLGGPCHNLPADAIAHTAPSIMQSLTGRLSSLSTLAIGVTVPYIPQRYKLWHQAFTDFLHICPNIAKFCLNYALEESDTGYNDFDSASNDPVLNGLSKWPTFHNLSTLKFNHVEIHPRDLVPYLERHRSTLRDVDLNQPWFGLKRNAWREVLTCLKGFELTRLQFSVNDIAYDYDLVDAKGDQIMVEIDRALTEGLRKPVLGPHEEDEWVSQGSSEDEGDDEGEEADYDGNVHFDEW